MSWITRNQSEDLAVLRSLVADLGAELIVVGATAFRAAGRCARERRQNKGTREPERVP